MNDEEFCEFCDLEKDECENCDNLVCGFCDTECNNCGNSISKEGAENDENFIGNQAKRLTFGSKVSGLSRMVHG